MAAAINTKSWPVDLLERMFLFPRAIVHTGTVQLLVTSPLTLNFPAICAPPTLNSAGCSSPFIHDGK